LSNAKPDLSLRGSVVALKWTGSSNDRFPPQTIVSRRDYESTLLFSQGGIKVKHEGIGIPAKLGNGEGYPLP
jgi:hypothetical protein